MSTLPPSMLPNASGSGPNAELRMLRNLLLAGCVAVLVNALLEFSHGRLSPWDRWAYPLITVVFACGAAMLQWRPRWERLVRRVTVVTLNVYLGAALYLVLLAQHGPPDLYQLVSNLYWLPLTYGCAFIFLSRRDALIVSACMYVTLFGGIFWLLQHGVIDPGPVPLGVILSNVAIAQLIYVVLLLAISNLRLDYLRTRERAEWMQQIAASDPLTGVANRRALNERLVGSMALLERHGQPLSLLLLDIDEFKQINDQHGHACGDAVLVELAGLMSEQLRVSDQLGRWGGEEFLVLAASTPLEAAVELAERIRSATQAHRFSHGQPVTVSIGVAQAVAGERPEQLVARADVALYEAKRRGRNQVRLHRLDTQPDTRAGTDTR
ncbi:GGDEF domain-containing protein [Ideonella alba]|uniref:diguanylate cyclase n=1 Tax=Ideonella alba TaxID=2824118 RepID=A0A941BA57_9BURK|nr:diguanylate cyclase [Ideonella alba]MBQ0929460.1 diguanylate cyclase [Ideonella alba]